LLESSGFLPGIGIEPGVGYEIYGDSERGADRDRGNKGLTPGGMAAGPFQVVPPAAAAYGTAVN
jgi:hypothetical protein